MKMLVTGGAGFIGHNVINILESLGHSVYAIDNFTDYGFVPRDELDYLKRGRCAKFRAGVHNVDIRDPKRIDDMLMSFQPSVVIHLASFPRQKVVLQDPILGSDVMCTGLTNLLEACRLNRIQRFVYVSSSMVYGDFLSDCVKEDQVCSPQGHYGIFKYAGELLAQDYERRGHFQSIVIRPSAVYGAWDVNDRVMSKFMLAAMRDETLTVRGADEILDFTYVTDTARGIAQASVNRQSTGTYNITRSDANTKTLAQAAHAIVDLVGRGRVDVVERDLNFPTRGRLDITRARQDFGYDPLVDFDQGIVEYHRWLADSEYWKSHT